MKTIKIFVGGYYPRGGNASDQQIKLIKELCEKNDCSSTINQVVIDKINRRSAEKCLKMLYKGNKIEIIDLNP
jgi:hypothetical protein